MTVKPIRNSSCRAGFFLFCAAVDFSPISLKITVTVLERLSHGAYKNVFIPSVGL